MYLDDIDDLVKSNSGVVHEEMTIPNTKDYGENFPPEQPEANEEEIIDKYLNAELILGLRMNDE